MDINFDLSSDDCIYFDIYESAPNYYINIRYKDGILFTIKLMKYQLGMLKEVLDHV